VRDLDLDTHVLALSAQQSLCTAPLIVAISAVVQRKPGHGIGYATAKFFGLDGASNAAIVSLFSRTSSSISAATLIISLLTTAALSTGVAAVHQHAFELIWNLPRRSGPRAYLRQLVWIPTMAGFTVGVLVATRVGVWMDEHLPGVGEWAVVALRAAIILGFYWWSQHWLLSGRIAWRALLPGAIAVAILTSVLVEVSRIVMPAQISWQLRAYGLIGAIFVLAIWLMILSTLIFAGVLIGSLLAQRPPPGKHPASIGASS